MSRDAAPTTLEKENEESQGIQPENLKDLKPAELELDDQALSPENDIFRTKTEKSPNDLAIDALEDRGMTRSAATKLIESRTFTKQEFESVLKDLTVSPEMSDKPQAELKEEGLEEKSQGFGELLKEAAKNQWNKLEGDTREKYAELSAAYEAAGSIEGGKRKFVVDTLKSGFEKVANKARSAAETARNIAKDQGTKKVVAGLTNQALTFVSRIGAVKLAKDAGLFLAYKAGAQGEFVQSSDYVKNHLKGKQAQNIEQNFEDLLDASQEKRNLEGRESEASRAAREKYLEVVKQYKASIDAATIPTDKKKLLHRQLGNLMNDVRKSESGFDAEARQKVRAITEAYVQKTSVAIKAGRDMVDTALVAGGVASFAVSKGALGAAEFAATRSGTAAIFKTAETAQKQHAELKGQTIGRESGRSAEQRQSRYAEKIVDLTGKLQENKAELANLQAAYEKKYANQDPGAPMIDGQGAELDQIRALEEKQHRLERSKTLLQERRALLEKGGQETYDAVLAQEQIIARKKIRNLAEKHNKAVASIERKKQLLADAKEDEKSTLLAGIKQQRKDMKSEKAEIAALQAKYTQLENRQEMTRRFENEGTVGVVCKAVAGRALETLKKLAGQGEVKLMKTNKEKILAIAGAYGETAGMLAPTLLPALAEALQADGIEAHVDDQGDFAVEEGASSDNIENAVRRAMDDAIEQSGVELASESAEEEEGAEDTSIFGMAINNLVQNAQHKGGRIVDAVGKVFEEEPETPQESEAEEDLLEIEDSPIIVASHDTPLERRSKVTLREADAPTRGRTIRRLSRDGGSSTYEEGTYAGYGNGPRAGETVAAFREDKKDFTVYEQTTLENGKKLGRAIEEINANSAREVRDASNAQVAEFTHKLMKFFEKKGANFNTFEEYLDYRRDPKNKETIAIAFGEGASEYPAGDVQHIKDAMQAYEQWSGEKLLEEPIDLDSKEPAMQRKLDRILSVFAYEEHMLRRTQIRDLLEQDSQLWDYVDPTDQNSEMVKKFGATKVGQLREALLEANTGLDMRYGPNFLKEGKNEADFLKRYKKVIESFMGCDLSGNDTATAGILETITGNFTDEEREQIIQDALSEVFKGDVKLLMADPDNVAKWNGHILFKKGAREANTMRNLTRLILLKAAEKEGVPLNIAYEAKIIPPQPEMVGADPLPEFKEETKVVRRYGSVEVASGVGGPEEAKGLTWDQLDEIYKKAENPEMDLSEAERILHGMYEELKALTQIDTGFGGSEVFVLGPQGRESFEDFIAGYLADSDRPPLHEALYALNLETDGPEGQRQQFTVEEGKIRFGGIEGSGDMPASFEMTYEKNSEGEYDVNLDIGRIGPDGQDTLSIKIDNGNAHLGSISAEQINAAVYGQDGKALPIDRIAHNIKNLVMENLAGNPHADGVEIDFRGFSASLLDVNHDIDTGKTSAESLLVTMDPDRPDLPNMIITGEGVTVWEEGEPGETSEHITARHLETAFGEKLWAKVSGLDLTKGPDFFKAQAADAGIRISEVGGAQLYDVLVDIQKTGEGKLESFNVAAEGGGELHLNKFATLETESPMEVRYGKEGDISIQLSGLEFKATKGTPLEDFMERMSAKNRPQGQEAMLRHVLDSLGDDIEGELTINAEQLSDEFTAEKGTKAELFDVAFATFGIEQFNREMKMSIADMRGLIKDLDTLASGEVADEKAEGGVRTLTHEERRTLVVSSANTLAESMTGRDMVTHADNALKEMYRNKAIQNLHSEMAKRGLSVDAKIAAGEVDRGVLSKTRSTGGMVEVTKGYKVGGDSESMDVGEEANIAASLRAGRFEEEYEAGTSDIETDRAKLMGEATVTQFGLSLQGQIENITGAGSSLRIEMSADLYRTEIKKLTAALDTKSHYNMAIPVIDESGKRKILNIPTGALSLDYKTGKILGLDAARVRVDTVVTAGVKETKEGDAKTTLRAGVGGAASLEKGRVKAEVQASPGFKVRSLTAEVQLKNNFSVFGKAESRKINTAADRQNTRSSVFTLGAQLRNVNVRGLNTDFGAEMKVGESGKSFHATAKVDLGGPQIQRKGPSYGKQVEQYMKKNKSVFEK